MIFNSLGPCVSQSAAHYNQLFCAKRVVEYDWFIIFI